MAYGRQRDARVAYVHNTVHRYRRRSDACAYACACGGGGGGGRGCVEDGATTRVADRNCEVEAMIEPVLQHIVYRGRRGRR